jgi:hypothetical protein
MIYNVPSVCNILVNFNIIVMVQSSLAFRESINGNPKSRRRCKKQLSKRRKEV